MSSSADDRVDDRAGATTGSSPGFVAAGDGERLQKVLARAGFGSRRVCEDLIADGHVTVDGVVPVLGARVRVHDQEIAVDDTPIGVSPDLVHYLLNKPAGVLTTASDTHGRSTVVELVPNDPRVHPVGRLDMETEGLLLLTNDGVLTHRITHPSLGVEKEYVAEVEGRPGRGALRRLRDGVELDDGMTAPAKVSELQPGLLRLTIHEGRNRQVRRMCEAIGHPVIRLVRTRIGPLRDPQLGPGEWRELTQDEVRALERATGPDPAPKDRPGSKLSPRKQRPDDDPSAASAASVSHDPSPDPDAGSASSGEGRSAGEPDGSVGTGAGAGAGASGSGPAPGGGRIVVDVVDIDMDSVDLDGLDDSSGS